MHLSGEDESVYLKRRKHLVWQLVPYIFLFIYFNFLIFFDTNGQRNPLQKGAKS
jgi:hypothetical protein